MTKIVDKYFQKHDFSTRVTKILAEVVEDTGFEVEKELFRGMIYDEDKLGSVIYKGKHKGKDAVLKLQGLEPETDEIDIVVNFDKQNLSKKVRLPRLFEYKHWNKKSRYGYLITEYIHASHIFDMPFANEGQMKLFSEFYEEYREKSLNKAFVKRHPDEKKASEFVIRRVGMWQRIAESKGILAKRIRQSSLENLIKTYKEVMKKELADVGMVFCHGHLTASDIFYDGKQFILLSNLYWSFRPEFYDLVFGLHWDIESINIPNYSYQELIKYIKKWLGHFYEIPVVKKDPDAKRKIHLMLLERTVGGILLDTGSQNINDKNKENLFSLQVIFFEDLIKRINSRIYL